MVVILDCCFAGRAINTLASYDAEDQAADLASVQGGCVLAAAARDELALAPLNSVRTAFTGELVDYLDYGDPGGPQWLTLRGPCAQPVVATPGLTWGGRPYAGPRIGQVSTCP